MKIQNLTYRLASQLKRLGLSHVGHQGGQDRPARLKQDHQVGGGVVDVLPRLLGHVATLEHAVVAFIACSSDV